MAYRPVYMVRETYPYFDTFEAEFTWNGGFAVSQKQKNIAAIHAAYEAAYPGHHALEISGKSPLEGGRNLSAFSLPIYVPELERSVPVENVFQGGKVFASGGPYTDLYTCTPKEAKRDPRLKESGALIGFQFAGQAYPTEPKTAFYDWLYLTALWQNPERAAMLLEYDGFTDIEFNPQKSLNCQAKAAALYVSLCRNGLLAGIHNFDDFLKIRKGGIDYDA